MKSARSATFVVAAIVTSATSCARVVGIDDAQLDPNLGTGGSGSISSLCSNYCDAVMANCQDTYSQYASRDACDGICGALEAQSLIGDPQHADIGNSLSCRLQKASAAGTLGEKYLYCPAAGPGGNGTCGTNCEGYCYLMKQMCPIEFAKDPLQNSLDSCLSVCGGLGTVDGGFNASQQSGNTINCRLYHVSAAAAAAVSGLQNLSATHCTHAAGANPCN